MLCCYHFAIVWYVTQPDDTFMNYKMNHQNDGGFLIISSNICHAQFSLKEVFFEAPCTFI